MNRGLALLLGAWFGGTFAAIATIAVNSAYEAQTLAGGVRMRERAVVWAILIGAFLGGVAADAVRRRS